MRATIHLGRLWGIRLGLHWSVLLIVVLLVVAIGMGRFPLAYPGYEGWAYLLAGLVAATLFMVSLLAHEMSHALVARREGQEVEGVTLWMLGGLATLKDRSRSPGAEFRVAAAGPATSVVLGVGFFLLAWPVAVANADVLVRGVLAYLAFINLVLAAFNLIPAAPLDGGRILSAALWRRWGDRHRAAVASTRVGRGFGFTLILLGAVTLFDGTTGGLWWMMIGAFIVVMAQAEQRQSELGAALSRLRVRDVMTADPDTADGGDSVSTFLRDTALVRRHSAFPLVDELGGLQGLITLNRLKAVPPAERDRTALRDAAWPPPEVPKVEPDDPLPDLLSVMGDQADGRALVFDQGRLVGIVSPTDISRAMVLHGLDIRR
ncbi:site-2 protease family protein [Saccharothrix isguenensis]